MKIDTSNIFKNYNIIAGVTRANKDLFPPYGFAITKGEIYTDEEIIEMRKHFFEYLKIDPENFVFQKQIHSDLVRIVDENYTYGEHDGLITKLKGKVLVLSLADCSGILIYDRNKEIISAVHSGWRGTAQNIIGKTINIMIDEFQSDPKDLLCYLSPSAGGNNYEIGAELLDKLGEFTIERAGKYYFDNKAMIKNQLLKIGILEENIETSEICTIENEDYHSFRRDKKESGRMAAFIRMEI